jgi:NADH dehydrogenase FAD-containing subunit
MIDVTQTKQPRAIQAQTSLVVESRTMTSSSNTNTTTFALGELVWAKMDAHCAWPAQVVHPQGDYAARDIRKRRQSHDQHRKSKNKKNQNSLDFFVF